jgi:hypothetical protein
LAQAMAISSCGIVEGALGDAASSRRRTRRMRVAERYAVPDRSDAPDVVHVIHVIISFELFFLLILNLPTLIELAKIRLKGEAIADDSSGIGHISK